MMVPQGPSLQQTRHAQSKQQQQHCTLCKTHPHTEAALAGRGNVHVLLDLSIVQTGIHLKDNVATTNGLDLERNSRTEEGSSHSKEGEKKEDNRLHDQTILWAEKVDGSRSAGSANQSVSPSYTNLP